MESGCVPSSGTAAAVRKERSAPGDLLIPGEQQGCCGWSSTQPRSANTGRSRGHLAGRSVRLVLGRPATGYSLGRAMQPVGIARERFDFAGGVIFGRVRGGRPQRFQKTLLDKNRQIVKLKSQEDGRLLSRQPCRQPPRVQYGVGTRRSHRMVQLATRTRPSPLQSGQIRASR